MDSGFDGVFADHTCMIFKRSFRPAECNNVACLSSWGLPYPRRPSGMLLILWLFERDEFFSRYRFLRGSTRRGSIRSRHAGRVDGQCSAGPILKFLRRSGMVVRNHYGIKCISAWTRAYCLEFLIFALLAILAALAHK